MALDSLFNQPNIPPAQQPPDRTDPAVAAARLRARRRNTNTGRRSTVLGGSTGGGETVARKQLLGQ
ncbi:MAG: hypothetical protein ACYS7M_10130, partial [Planctomycetota bacterium]|jgi:hypothetical protein